MKPRELTVYPLDPAFPAGYKLPRDTRITFNKANRMAVEKRLTLAECAAEFIRAEHDWDAASFGFEGWALGTWRGAYLGWAAVAEDRRNALYRFATLPHYDEETTP